MTGDPKILEMIFVAQGIHRAPEAIVPVRDELRVTREPLQRFLLPHVLIALEVLEISLARG